MSQQFNNVNVASTSRSTISLSHHQVTTSDFGYLVPICVRDMVPNDDFVVTPRVFCRLAPLAVPVYGKITCRIHSFFVPYRLLFKHWSAFITQSSSNYHIPPFFTVSTLRQALQADPQFSQDSSLTNPRGIYGRLMSNIGVNPALIASGSGLNSQERISAFRWLAYYRIWMDWFMDSNIYDHSEMVEAFNTRIGDGGSIVAGATDFLRYRNCCFGKDYFTTAKLHPQAGAQPSFTAVQLGKDVNPDLAAPSSQANLKVNPDGSVQVQGSPSNANSNIGQFTIEELRAANALQRYLERNNYVGSKIINQLLVHFGISPTPERLDMSEFLGGSNFDIQIGDVTSHSSYTGDNSTDGIGMQAGKGIGASQTEQIRYHAKEHGVFMTLMSIVPDTAYYQGIPKVMQLGVTGDPLDFYTPEFENLGFQEILNKEVYVPSAGEMESYPDYDPDGIFGYAPRYGFLKWQHDILAGDFVGYYAPGTSPMRMYSMDQWHLFRKFVYDSENPLALNSNFVELDRDNNDYDRIFQIFTNKVDHFYFNIDVDVKATRPMTGFAEPSLDATNTGDGNSISLPYGGTRL